MRAFLSLAGFVAIMSLVAGCGGSSSKTVSNNATAPVTTSTSSTSSQVTQSSTTPSASLPAVAFVAKANAICLKMTKQLDAGSNVVIKTQADMARIYPQRAVIVQAAATDLGKLTPPPAMAAAYKRVVATRKGIAEDLAKYASEVKEKNENAQTELAVSYRTLQAETKVKAESSGLRACARIT